MKKMMATTLLSLASFATFAGPLDPMDYYQPDNLDKSTFEYVWKNMTNDLRGKDCYKRAGIWSMSMDNKNGDLINSTKVFMHYTNKFKRELDALGFDAKGKFRMPGTKLGKRLTALKLKDVLTPAELYLFKTNKTWGYHVSSSLTVNGEVVVVDKTLEIPYLMKKPYRPETNSQIANSKYGHMYLNARSAKEVSNDEITRKNGNIVNNAQPSTIKEWTEALAYRGEMLWNIRKKLTEIEIAEARADGDYNTARKLQNQMRTLNMDNQKYIDISCKEAKTMAEVDAAQETEWCLYTVVPMYYYNNYDTRNIAYGILRGLNYRDPVPTEYHTEENFNYGKEYILKEFNIKKLKESLGEINDRDTKDKMRKRIKKMEERQQ